MSPEISERSFEEAIECGLLQHGPDACAGEANAVRETPPPYGETPPGGYRRRKPEDYDRTLGLLPRDVLDFVLATQPKEWKKLDQHHGKEAVREQFLNRLAGEIERRGALDVLRNGLKAVLSSGSLEEAEEEEEAGAATPEEELESTILAEMEKRGRLPNLSTFAFTATPKPKTIELFGTKRPDGKFAPFHLSEGAGGKMALDKVATGSYSPHMRSVGIKVLKNKLSEYIRLAAAGETILVSDRDRVVAEIGPPSLARGPWIADALLADAVRNGSITPALMPPGPPPEAKPVAPLAELLRQLDRDRDDR